MNHRDDLSGGKGEWNAWDVGGGTWDVDGAWDIAAGELF